MLAEKRKRGSFSEPQRSNETTMKINYKLYLNNRELYNNILPFNLIKGDKSHFKNTPIKTAKWYAVVW